MVPNMLAVNPSLPGQVGQGAPCAGQGQAGRAELRLRRQRQRGDLAASTSSSRPGQHRAHPVPRDRAGGDGPDRGPDPMMITGVPPLLQQVKAGKLRGWWWRAASGCRCCPMCRPSRKPGVPGFEASQWYGLLAPAGTPRPIVPADKGIARARAARRANGSRPKRQWPRHHARAVRRVHHRRIERWAPVVKAAGVKAD